MHILLRNIEVVCTISEAYKRDVVEVLHKGFVSPSPKPALNLFIFSL